MPLGDAGAGQDLTSCMQTEFVTSRQPAFQVVAGAGGFPAGQEVPHPACAGTSSLCLWHLCLWQ